MHDPWTQAFEIRTPWKQRHSQFGHVLMVIWHVDPAKDGTDDSCGWFIRDRHIDPELLKRVKSRFEQDWDRVYVSSDEERYARGLFLPPEEGGVNNFSVMGVTLNLMFGAAFEIFGHNRRKTYRYINRHLGEILLMAENPVDSFYDSIACTFAEPDKAMTKGDRELRIADLAGLFTAYILRSVRPWYRHPRWHFWHWKITTPLTTQLYRFLFDRCAICKGRFKWKEHDVYSDWEGTNRYHGRCYETQHQPTHEQAANTEGKV